MYCKIAFEIVWLGSRISIHFNKTERDDIIKAMFAGYYLKVEPELTNLCHWYDHLYVYTRQTDQEAWPWPAR